MSADQRLKALTDANLYYEREFERIRDDLEELRRNLEDVSSERNGLKEYCESLEAANAELTEKLGAATKQLEAQNLKFKEIWKEMEDKYREVARLEGENEELQEKLRCARESLEC
jgi:chromosome segregation ATPase